jgi:hypothetical protein
MSNWRRLGVLLGLAIVPLGVGWGQVKEEPKTKEPSTHLEAFLAKKGKLVIKDFHELGVIKGKFGARISFDAVMLYEPGMEKESVKGLRVEVKEAGRLERENTSFLDIDEVESLSKAMDYVAGLSAKWKSGGKEYSEAVFSTKGDFQIGFYQKGEEAGAFASSGYVGKTDCFLSLDDLGSVKEIAEKGLQWLRAQ